MHRPGERGPDVFSTKPLRMAVLPGSNVNPSAAITAVIDRLYSNEYNLPVFTIKRTDEFNAWLLGLKDSLTHRRLLARLRRASVGNLGDVKPVGAGVFEMREHFGPGWRMYYIQRGAVVIVMLGGGGKSTQQADIAAAQALAVTIEE